MKTITDNISAIDEKINELKGISDTAAETYNKIKRELEECKARSSEQERIIADALDVEAQADAEKARAKSGAAEDKPMPPKPSPKKRMLVTPEEKAQAKEAKEAKAAAKEAAKELAKEEKEKLKKLREDAMAKGKAAKIMSGTGGQIRNY